MVAYEQGLHPGNGHSVTSQVEAKDPFMKLAICAYNTNQVPIQIFRDLISAHTNSLFLGLRIQMAA
jgi:uncharacterized membrane protein